MKIVVKSLVVLAFLIVFIIPGYTYFYVNQAATSALFSPGVDLSARMYLLFRLFGLYALALLWGQIILGPFMSPLEQLFGAKIFYLHRAEGIFALTLATLHPLIFYLAFLTSGTQEVIWGAIGDYFGNGPLTIYGWLGPAAWTLLVTTVLTALLMNRPWFVSKWHYFHYLNYLVFILALVHSINVGTEVKLDPLHTLYYFYGLTFALAVVYRVIYRRLVWVLVNRV